MKGTEPMAQSTVRTVLITGGAGFIGSNLAERLLAIPVTRVRIFDNLSRAGVEHNLRWLRSLPGGDRLEVVTGDVRDPRAVQRAVSDASAIYHLAAQVAVTSSVADPAHDFEVNARGTFNVLEAARRSDRSPFVLFTSTNKVYGSLSRLPVEVCGSHYAAAVPGFHGVNESEPLDFHSPYGCSKGAADQYVRDYARIYNLPTVVFRMSCIAGPRQFGNEDQGWVAHFLYSILAGRPITIYGDGYQVRDILHVHDLVDAMIEVRAAIDRTRGQVFNVGGGMKRAVSVSEMLDQIQQQTGKPPRRRFCDVRPGDQPLYISDTTKLEKLTGWRARRSLADTLETIQQFWLQNRDKIERPLAIGSHHAAEAAEMEVA
jgi:CDP-paratose 2-epimerase